MLYKFNVTLINILVKEFLCKSQDSSKINKESKESVIAKIIFQKIINVGLIYFILYNQDII